MSPTARAAALLGLAGLAALIVPPLVALLAAVAVIVATVVDATFVRGRAELAAEVPELLARGVPEPLTVAVAGAPAGSTRIRQPAPADIRIDGSEAEGGLSASIVAERRGRHVLPGIGVRRTGPLGLASWTRIERSSREVLVYPDLPAARRIAAAARYSRYRDPGNLGRGPLGLGTEFEAVREYQPDDDIRQVNWRATARLGRPMSNDYRLEQDRDLICVLDSGRLMGAPIGGVTRLDAALDATCAVAAVADDLRDRFGVLAFDSSIRARVAPTRQGGLLSVRTLFDLEATTEQSDYRRAFHSLEADKRAFVLLFTDLLEEAAARPLVDAMPVLARKHAVAVVTVADPELAAPLAGPPRDTVDVMRGAAALEVFSARRRAAAAIRATGTPVIEAEASALGAACVREYLRAKARARL
jgi:uncharacterized protein (DUF58 family)